MPVMKVFNKIVYEPYSRKCQGLEPVNNIVSYWKNLILWRRGVVISGKRWTKRGFLGFLAQR